MSRANIRFNCGCGFKCGEALVAMSHVDDTGHSMEVNGRVEPDGGKNKKAKGTTWNERKD
jgi:hypothetical protein